jgi:hypothetical protein
MIILENSHLIESMALNERKKPASYNSSRVTIRISYNIGFLFLFYLCVHSVHNEKRMLIKKKTKEKEKNLFFF